MNRSMIHRNDTLAYLPKKPLVPYLKGTTIYSGNSESLYLVTSGRVNLLIIAPDGSDTTLRIVPREGLFGESYLVGGRATERAVALDDVHLMAWKWVDIVQQIEKEPRLGLALIENVIVDTLEVQDRVQAMATCKTPQRVVLSILQLARALGSDQGDGSVRMSPLTHRLIAKHVGTSREIVSSEMNHLRRLGLIRYSRKQIEVYCDALREHLRASGLALPSVHGAAMVAGRPA